MQSQRRPVDRMPAEKAEAVREPPEFPAPPLAEAVGLALRVRAPPAVRLGLPLVLRPASGFAERFDDVRREPLAERRREPRPPPDRWLSVAPVADDGVGETKARVPGAISARSGWPAFRRVVVAVIPALRVSIRTSRS